MEQLSTLSTTITVQYNAVLTYGQKKTNTNAFIHTYMCHSHKLSCRDVPIYKYILLDKGLII